MKNVVGFVALGIVALVGCAMPSGDGDQSAELASLSSERMARSDECLLGAGLYCGGNGVDGPVKYLFRCSRIAGTQAMMVKTEQICAAACEHMPDGQNDRCATYNGPLQPAPVSESGNDKPVDPAPVVVEGQENWTSCTTDQQCASKRCGCSGGTEKVCLPSADYPKECSQPPAPAPTPTPKQPPLCSSIGPSCSWFPATGSFRCRPDNGPDVDFYCCPTGKSYKDGVCK